MNRRHEPVSVEIAAFRDDFDVPRVARGGRAPASGGITGIASGGHRFIAEVPQHIAVILDPPCDHMDDVAVFVALVVALRLRQDPLQILSSPPVGAERRPSVDDPVRPR